MSIQPSRQHGVSLGGDAAGHLAVDGAATVWARTLSSTCPTCSLTYCCVRAAHGVKEALWQPGQHTVHLLRPRNAASKLALDASAGWWGVRDILAESRHLPQTFVESVHVGGAKMSRKCVAEYVGGLLSLCSFAFMC